MPRVKVNGVDTHYQQVGAGPDVVLIHAFTSNLAVWMLTGIVEALKGFRVTMYDLRGHGATEVPLRGYTSAHLVEDWLALHEQLGLGPAFLVGHSYGGVIGMHAASLHPERVRGVILSDTYFPGLRDLEPDMGQAGVWMDLRRTVLKTGDEIGDRVDFSRLFRVVRDWKEEQFQIIKDELGPPGARWLTQIGQLAATTAGEEAFETAGFTADKIAAVTQPVAGLYDEFSPFGATRDFLQQNLRHCEIDIVPGAKHLAPVENSAEFVRLVRKYLDQWQASS